jgi:hypothetical protein
MQVAQLVANPLRFVSLNSLRMAFAVKRIAPIASSSQTFCVPVSLLKAKLALEMGLIRQPDGLHQG